MHFSVKSENVYCSNCEKLKFREISQVSHQKWIIWYRSNFDTLTNLLKQVKHSNFAWLWVTFSCDFSRFAYVFISFGTNHAFKLLFPWIFSMYFVIYFQIFQSSETFLTKDTFMRIFLRLPLWFICRFKVTINYNSEKYEKWSFTTASRGHIFDVFSKH